MGFQRKTLHLVFEDPELEGLEVRAKRFTVRELFTLGDTAWGLQNNDPKTLAILAELMASKILSWNLEDAEGNQIPVTPQAITDMDEDLLSAIMRAITSASKGSAKGQSAPFATPPNGGPSDRPDPDMEASIPMT